MISGIVLTVIIAYLIKKFNDSKDDVLMFQHKQYGDSKKPSLVIIPGLDGTPAFFADIIPELTEKFHVILYFSPLKSSKMTDSDYSYEFLVKDVIELLEKLDIKKFTIVGEASGGVIGQLIAYQYPDRVQSLILMSSMCVTDLPPEILKKAKIILPVMKFIGSFFPELALSLFINAHVNDVIVPSEPPYVKKLYMKIGKESHFPSILARLKLGLSMDIREKTKELKLPTLIVRGADDLYTGKDSEKLQKTIINSQIRTLPGGHLFHLSQPKPFADLVKEFLRPVYKM